MAFQHALLRLPGPDFAAGQTTAELGCPDFDRLLEQHSAYREALENLGLTCTVLPALAGAPDAYFVEDTAIVTDDLAVITRPGHKSRQGETASIATAISAHKPLAYIEAPATVDGGDIMFAEGHCYIGVSGRTNQAGAEQLTKYLHGVGIGATIVPVPDGLHLKSSVNYLENGRMLLTEAFVDAPAFAEFERIVLDPQEAYAANTLWINGTLLTPSGYPKLHAKLEALGYPLVQLDMSEVAKMDGGLSCLSLRI